MKRGRNMDMPFGKYKGEALEDIPIAYLNWLYENVELHGELEEAISEILYFQPGRELMGGPR